MLEPALTQRLETLWRMESPVLIARLARLLGGDVGRAEELAQDTWLAALERWPEQGIPDNPGAWLMTTARNRAIDVLRQHQRVAQQHAQWGEELHPAPLPAPDDSQALEDDLGDDLLRLMFVACHPVLPADARVALTLRLLGGLTTVEIARAFLQPEPTIAQRIVRAKRTLAQKQVPYEVPRADAMPERLGSVLEAIYLVFNEGYSASVGAELTREDLTREAIRLGRLLMELLPEPEVMGLLAMMLLHESRRSARTSPDGELVLLDDQDRSLWDSELIAEGCALVERALTTRRFGPYCLQAAIAAVHAEAPTAAQTDWEQIVGLYDVLLRAVPSPVIELNRAVAVAKRDGALAGLQLIEGILARGELQDYHLAHSARAEFCRQLGRVEEARAAYRRALELTRQEPERRFIEGRLQELAPSNRP